MTDPSITAAQHTTRFDGGRHAQIALICGIVGFFFLGIVFGPIAIIQARKAERVGVPATVGKFLGWIDTILWVVGLLAGAAVAWVVYANLGQ